MRMIFKLFKPKGFRGPRGEQGEVGIQGKQGYPGLRGEEGDQGPRGLVGEPGERGLKGPRGNEGYQGDRGIQGDRGPQGPKGYQGLKGKIGPIGEKGERGEEGPKGIPGPQGEIGFEGPQGERGDIGRKGPKFKFEDFTQEQIEKLKCGPIGDPGNKGLSGVFTGFDNLTPEQKEGLRGDEGPVGPKGDKGFNFVNDNLITDYLKYHTIDKIVKQANNEVENEINFISYSDNDLDYLIDDLFNEKLKLHKIKISKKEELEKIKKLTYEYLKGDSFTLDLDGFNALSESEKENISKTFYDLKRMNFEILFGNDSSSISSGSLDQHLELLKFLNNNYIKYKNYKIKDCLLSLFNKDFNHNYISFGEAKDKYLNFSNFLNVNVKRKNVEKLGDRLVSNEKAKDDEDNLYEFKYFENGVNYYLSYDEKTGKYDYRFEPLEYYEFDTKFKFLNEDLITAGVPYSYLPPEEKVFLQDKYHSIDNSSLSEEDKKERKMYLTYVVPRNYQKVKYLKISKDYLICLFYLGNGAEKCLHPKETSEFLYNKENYEIVDVFPMLNPYKLSLIAQEHGKKIPTYKNENYYFINEDYNKDYFIYNKDGLGKTYNTYGFVYKLGKKLS